MLACWEDQAGRSAGEMKLFPCFRISIFVSDGSELANLLVKLDLIPGKIDRRSAPVNGVGDPVKFNGVPCGTPGIPANGLGTALPSTVWRPEPAGPSSAR